MKKDLIELLGRMLIAVALIGGLVWFFASQPKCIKEEVKVERVKVVDATKTTRPVGLPGRGGTIQISYRTVVRHNGQNCILSGSDAYYKAEGKDSMDVKVRYRTYEDGKTWVVVSE